MRAAASAQPLVTSLPIFRGLSLPAPSTCNFQIQSLSTFRGGTAIDGNLPCLFEGLGHCTARLEIGKFCSPPKNLPTNADSMDNSLPHLQTDQELLHAAQQAYEKVRLGGFFIGSIRDYDQLIAERPTSQGPSFYSDGGGRRIIFQVWDWLDERRYRFHLYITRSTESAWQTFHFTATYRGVRRNELRHILEQAGFTNVRWLPPSETDFYQPIFIAQR